MLVLSRKENESIVLTTQSGETITVAVNKVKGNRVSLSIEAPKSVKVLRAELSAKETSPCETGK